MKDAFQGWKDAMPKDMKGGENRMDGSKLRWRLKDGRINIKNSGEDDEDGQKGRNTMIIHVYGCFQK